MINVTGSMNTPAPDVYNAVYNATGIRIYDRPLTPEKVLNTLSEQ